MLVYFFMGFVIGFLFIGADLLSDESLIKESTFEIQDTKYTAKNKKFLLCLIIFFMVNYILLWPVLLLINLYHLFED